uniref:SWIM-type domain-containing protein n=1 Tax=Panagrellus redivivus TaxID=6233 RepID=A0A7E4ZSD1_PANRE
MEGESVFQKLLEKNRTVVNKARLNQCLFEVSGSYKPLPPPDEEYVHATLEPYPDFSDELYDRIRERKLFPIRIRTRPGNMKAYIKVVFRNGVEECYNIKAATRLLPPIVSGRAPIQWATDSSYCPYGFNGPFMYKGHMIAFLDDELICLFTTDHFWEERRKFIQKYNSNGNIVSIDRMNAYETPFTEYVLCGWFAPADLKLQEKTHQELQQRLKEAREERRIDCKAYQEALFDTEGLSKEERMEVLKRYESYLFQESLDRKTITFEFEEEPAFSKEEVLKQVSKMTKHSSKSTKRKLNHIAIDGNSEELVPRQICQKRPTKSGRPDRWG